MTRDKVLLQLLRNLLEEITEKYDSLLQLKEQQAKEFFNLATKDPLTSLYNRYFFFDFLKASILRIQREKEFGKKIALVFIDIDNFKQVNDLFGHEKGDILLKEIAEFFKREIRKSDIIARFGGDEFVVLFEGIDITKESIKERFERIREEFNDYFKEYQVSFSYGIALFPDEVPNWEDKSISDIQKYLIKLADDRMYKDKLLRKEKNSGGRDGALSSNRGGSR